MQEILLTGYCGDQSKTIKLSPVSGAGEVLHIMVDNWYHGKFYKENGQWSFWINANSDLCSNDIEVMREEIKNS